MKKRNGRGEKKVFYSQMLASFRLLTDGSLGLSEAQTTFRERAAAALLGRNEQLNKLIVHFRIQTMGEL